MMHTVPQTILAQLGGNRFTAMTGAYSFAGSADTLSFRIPQSNKGRFGGVRITLTPADLYDVHFVRLTRDETGFLATETITHEGIFADGLSEIITEETGLATTL
ncbi:hypothetical protein [Mesorhizobium denitrificans]|nr:hypothetical protein [Mesorhizobium denitrificans]